MDTRRTLKLCEKAIEKTPPALTGVVAELAGILAGKEIDLSKDGRARYLASRTIRPRLKPGARNGCPSGTEK